MAANFVARWLRRFAALWCRVQRLRPLRTLSHFTNVGGGVLAGGMSYQAIFAVFAGLFVGFGIFSLVLRSHPLLLTQVVQQLNLLVPGLLGSDGVVSVQLLLNTSLLDLTGLAAAVSLVWVALNWFTGTRRSIRIIFGLEVKEYRNPLLLKARDLLLASGFLLAIIVSALLLVITSQLSEQLLLLLGLSPHNWLLGGIGATLRYAVMYFFDVLLLFAIHRYLAEVTAPRGRIVAGCMLGGGSLFVLKLLGTLLLTGATTNPLLASFAIFIGLLIWFNFICRSLLLTSAWIATGLDKTLGL